MSPIRNITCCGWLLLILACFCPGCVQSPKTQARVARPSRGDLVGLFAASGRVKSHLIRVHSGFTGRLLKLEVEENQKVHKGQVLAILNSQEQAADLEVFRAELETARQREMEAVHASSLRRSQLKGLLDGAAASQVEAEARLRLARKPQTHELAKVRAAQRGVEARLALAKNELARTRRLYSQDVVSATQVEKAETEVKAALSEFEQTLAQSRIQQELPRPEEVDALSARLAKTRADRLQAEDSLDAETQVYEARLRAAIQETNRAQGRLKAALVRIERSLVKAPEDGVILQLHFEPGEFVDWLQPLLTMVASRGLRVEAEVDEQDAAKVVLNMPVEVSFTSMPGQNFAGKVVQISPALERRPRGPAESRILRIRVQLDNPPGTLRDGLEAQVEGSRILSKDTLLIPRSAIIREDGADHVMELRNGKAARLNVQLGEATTDRVELKGGADQNTLVVVEGADRIAEGAEVEPLP